MKSKACSGTTTVEAIPICWFHKWTKWDRYQRPIFNVIDGKKYSSVVHYQRRKCIKCGYEEEERIW